MITREAYSFIRRFGTVKQSGRDLFRLNEPVPVRNQSRSFRIKNFPEELAILIELQDC